MLDSFDMFDAINDQLERDICGNDQPFASDLYITASNFVCLCSVQAKHTNCMHPLAMPFQVLR